MTSDRCRCPEGLVPSLDRRVVVATTCEKITGVLLAVGETFLEVSEDEPRVEMTVIQCVQLCLVRLIG